MIIEGQGPRSLARTRKNWSDSSDSSGSKLFDFVAPNRDTPQTIALTAQ